MSASSTLAPAAAQPVPNVADFDPRDKLAADGALDKTYVSRAYALYNRCHSARKLFNYARMASPATTIKFAGRLIAKPIAGFVAEKTGCPRIKTCVDAGVEIATCVSDPVPYVTYLVCSKGADFLATQGIKKLGIANPELRALANVLATEAACRGSEKITQNKHIEAVRSAANQRIRPALERIDQASTRGINWLLARTGIDTEKPLLCFRAKPDPVAAPSRQDDITISVPLDKVKKVLKEKILETVKADPKLSALLDLKDGAGITVEVSPAGNFKVIIPARVRDTRQVVFSCHNFSAEISVGGKLDCSTGQLQCSDLTIDPKVTSREVTTHNTGYQCNVKDEAQKEMNRQAHEQRAALENQINFSLYQAQAAILGAVNNGITASGLADLSAANVNLHSIVGNGANLEVNFSAGAAVSKHGYDALIPMLQGKGYPLPTGGEAQCERIDKIYYQNGKLHIEGQFTAFNKTSSCHFECGVSYDGGTGELHCNNLACQATGWFGWFAKPFSWSVQAAENYGIHVGLKIPVRDELNGRFIKPQVLEVAQRHDIRLDSEALYCSLDSMHFDERRISAHVKLQETAAAAQS